MEVEVGRVASLSTPASEMSAYVVEHVGALMTLGGIESINSVKYDSGFGSRLHVSIAPFADAPREIADIGIVMKDALAQVLSVANVNRVVLKPSSDDLANIRNTWHVSVMSARESNMGSGQDFSGKSRREAGDPA